MRKKKVRKSGVLTLRLPPSLHEDLSRTAAELGLDLTGLIRLMIWRSLPHYQFEARLIVTMAQEQDQLLEDWRRTHPGSPIREFWDHYYLHQRSKEWRPDIIDPRFTLDEAHRSSFIDHEKEKQS